MDLVRHYYASQNMTAPAYRLEYIYNFTHGPNYMRRFLTSTAAFRALEEAPRQEITAANPMLHKTFYAPGSYISQSIQHALGRNSDLAVDFAEALVRLQRSGEHDVRHGQACEFHVHETSAKCKNERLEPWQSDGPADAKVRILLHSQSAVADGLTASGQEA